MKKILVELGSAEKETLAFVIDSIAGRIRSIDSQLENLKREKLKAVTELESKKAKLAALQSELDKAREISND